MWNLFKYTTIECKGSGLIFFDNRLLLTWSLLRETASYPSSWLNWFSSTQVKESASYHLLPHLLLGKLPLSEVHLQSLAHRLHVQPLARMASFCSRAHSHEHYLWKYSLLVFYSKELIQIWMLQNPTGSTSRQMVIVGTQPWTTAVSDACEVFRIYIEK